MASTNQNFITYVGDTVVPIFTVLDLAGAVVDISSVTQITWAARRSLTSDPVLSKSKTAGQISFVTNGSDGKFQVLITSADTTLLDGYYLHQASLTDALGNITTVTVGEMQVGVQPDWTYNPSSLSTSSLYQVRLLIGDVLPNDKQMLDPEVQMAISRYSNVYLAAAECCRNLATRMARQVDISEGQLQKSYGQRSKQYQALAVAMEQRGLSGGAIGLGGVFAGGISVQQKIEQQQDTDRVQPQFNLLMDDNLIIPIGPVGNQTPTTPAPTGAG